MRTVLTSMCMQDCFKCDCVLIFILNLAYLFFRMDLAEGIALRGGVNLDRLQSLLKQEENSTAEALLPYAHNAHSRFLPELSLGIQSDMEFN